MPLERRLAERDLRARVVRVREAWRGERGVRERLPRDARVGEERQDRVVVRARRGLDVPARERCLPGGNHVRQRAGLPVEQVALLALGEPMPALPEVDEQRVLQELRARPREVEQDDEVAEVGLLEGPTRLGPGLEVGEAGEAREDAVVHGEEVLEGKAPRARVPRRDRSPGDLEERVRAALREHLDLVEESRDEVRGVRDAGIRREERGQRRIVLERVEAHPRQRRGLPVERDVPRLVEVPEEEDAERGRRQEGPFYRTRAAGTSRAALLECASPGPPDEFGSRATVPSEPCQVRKEAALRSKARAPRIARTHRGARAPDSGQLFSSTVEP